MCGVDMRDWWVTLQTLCALLLLHVSDKSIADLRSKGLQLRFCDLQPFCTGGRGNLGGLTACEGALREGAMAAGMVVHNHQCSLSDSLIDGLLQRCLDLQLAK